MSAQAPHMDGAVTCTYCGGDIVPSIPDMGWLHVHREDAVVCKERIRWSYEENMRLLAIVPKDV